MNSICPTDSSVSTRGVSSSHILQRLEKRVSVGSVVEREDERAVRRWQRRVLVHLRANRRPAAQYPEETLGHRRLSRSAHADQCTHTAAASSPPFAGAQQ